MSGHLTTRQARALNKRRKTHGGGTGRPLGYPRCPCGAMTRARAKKRNHKCEKE